MNVRSVSNMTIEEIKFRRIANQYLTAPADKLTVVRDLCGIQSQFMVNVMHSLKIRCSDLSAGQLGADARAAKIFCRPYTGSG